MIRAAVSRAIEWQVKIKHPCTLIGSLATDRPRCSTSATQCRPSDRVLFALPHHHPVRSVSLSRPRTSVTSGIKFYLAIHVYLYTSLPCPFIFCTPSFSPTKCWPCLTIDVFYLPSQLPNKPVKDQTNSFYPLCQQAECMHLHVRGSKYLESWKHPVW